MNTIRALVYRNQTTQNTSIYQLCIILMLFGQICSSVKTLVGFSPISHKTKTFFRELKSPILHQIKKKCYEKWGSVQCMCKRKHSGNFTSKWSEHTGISVELKSAWIFSFYTIRREAVRPTDRKHQCKFLLDFHLTRSCFYTWVIVSSSTETS